MAIRERKTSATASEFLKAAAKSKDLSRELDKDTEYKKDNVHHITDMLSSLYKGSTALMDASKALTDISAHEISPDGKLGGKGYVMQIKQIREDIASALNLVSNLTDTLSDELTNPKWELTEDQVNDLKNKAKSGEKSKDEDIVPASEATEEIPSDEEMDKIVDSFGDNAPVNLGETPEEAPEAPAEEPDASESATAEAPQQESAPEAETATSPAEPVQKLPYIKLASDPSQDFVSRVMRAPILFNLLDGHPAGRK